MTLDEAIKELEQHFDSVKVRSTTEIRDFATDCDQICSGGICKPGDIMPALYSSKEAAVHDWLMVAMSEGHRGKNLEWVMKPELVEYQITMADRIGRHRAVGNRYAVKSQFVAS